MALELLPPPSIHCSGELVWKTLDSNGEVIVVLTAFMDRSEQQLVVNNRLISDANDVLAVANWLRNQVRTDTVEVASFRL